jgi:hypothetical protein
LWAKDGVLGISGLNVTFCFYVTLAAWYLLVVGWEVMPIMLVFSLEIGCVRVSFLTDVRLSVSIGMACRGEGEEKGGGGAASGLTVCRDVKDGSKPLSSCLVGVFILGLC